MLECVGSRCWTTTNAMPVSRGSSRMSRDSASMPPAEAPMPTTTQPARGASAAGARLRPLRLAVVARFAAPFSLSRGFASAPCAAGLGLVWAGAGFLRTMGVRRRGDASLFLQGLASGVRVRARGVAVRQHIARPVAPFPLRDFGGAAGVRHEARALLEPVAVDVARAVRIDARERDLHQELGLVEFPEQRVLEMQSRRALGA